MAHNEDQDGHPAEWQSIPIQRRGSSWVDHLRPQRWNWYALVRPLDHVLAQQSAEGLAARSLRSLRYFWLDGLFAAISENFYLSFIPLFALAYGATNRQVGAIAAGANLLGALSLFPGARLVEQAGQRKPVVVWSAGIFGRFALLALALIPLLFANPAVAIIAIIALNGFRSFMANLANPGWTALVADIVPNAMRGRFFASRNTAMGLAALLVAPLAGRIIALINGQLGVKYAGYQTVFFLAFAFGMVSTVLFQRIDEPARAEGRTRPHRRGDLRRALRQSPGLIGLVISAFVWNLALQIAAPFLDVYLVSHFGASTATIGLLAAVSSLFALVGQHTFGRWMDRKGAFWVMTLTGLLIPFIPLLWLFLTAPWQVGLINIVAGFLWAGYGLANFNLLLTLTPDDQRPRSVALYQLAVFAGAVTGPLIGGYLADAFDFRINLALSAAGRMLGTILFLWLVLRYQRTGDSGSLA